jgi:tRNA1(Val) A37 N6-methylase TrmN6
MTRTGRENPESTWRPSGPAPVGDAALAAWAPAEDETCDALSGRWRIYQLRSGHRYSLDDQLTADFAVETAAARGVRVARALDLGCGIGSVMLMVAWRLPGARSVGVEAQSRSAALARRSVAFNGVAGRVEVREGDLRTVDVGPERFDLVTGSPPYLPYGTGTVSARPQCEPCRFEARGGAEDYLLAAARWLAPGGVAVICHAARDRERVLAAGAAAGLDAVRVQDVVPREGKPPLLALFAFVPGGEGRGRVDEPPLLVRDRAGARTAEYGIVRARMGFPP